MAREFDLYIIPTPIGNIQDITLRAISILKQVDIIACEDTRNTIKLLNHYDIKTKCVSYHKYNETERLDFFLKELKAGKKIALVSDAGTPMICDPGNILIKSLLENGFSITSLPGACAVTTFLSQIPREGEEFSFIGFIPRTEVQIKSTVQKYADKQLVFYDSPERILKTLEKINEVRPNAKTAIGRELSKLFEEIVIDTIPNILNHYKDGIKGEIVCSVYPDERTENSDMLNKINELKKLGFKNKEISLILSTLFQFNKNDVYRICLNSEEND